MTAYLLSLSHLKIATTTTTTTTTTNSDGIREHGGKAINETFE